MFGTLKGRILIIVAVLAVSGWYLYTRGITLGLDLQGGMHLVLEVSDPEGTMTAEARADATDRALKIIRTRINEFGVDEPLIQKVGSDRIIVELAGIRDEDRAKAVIQRAAFLEFKLVDESGVFAQALPRIDRAVVDALGAEALAELDSEPNARQAVQDLLFGTSDSAAAAPDTAGAVADTAGAAADTAGADSAATVQSFQDSVLQARPFTSALLESGQRGEFLVASDDVERLERYLALPEVESVIPRDIELAWATEPEGVGAELYRRLYVVGAETVMSGQELENAVAGRQTTQFNETVVNFELSRRGGREFAEVTGANVNRRLAILLDNQVVSAPVIQSRIGASGVITLGSAPIEEARDLALVLRAGALPAPLDIVEERTIGPSLGADSVEDGKIAGMVGLALVVLITLVYYQLAGILAIGGLAVYVMLVLGGLSGFGAELTAPGIAGLILSIGMAIDANVLVFERIREEMALGRTVRGAVDAGFDNAMSAIVDSNLTTLITALVLYQFGTGPVQGFAVTLAIGILASFFSAVYVTRTLFLLYLERRSSTAPLRI